MSLVDRTVRDFMTPDPCAVDEALTVADAADRMAANNIRHLLVVRGDRLTGVVDARDLDLAIALSHDDGRKTPVVKAERDAFLCSPDTRLGPLVQEMERQRYACAVVVERERVVGIFTLTDALRALRSAVEGYDVAPEVRPTHKRAENESEPAVEHGVRVGRILRAHQAAPSPSDGLVFGRVFTG